MLHENLKGTQSVYCLFVGSSVGSSEDLWLIELKIKEVRERCSKTSEIFCGIDWPRFNNQNPMPWHFLKYEKTQIRCYIVLY